MNGSTVTVVKMGKMLGLHKTDAYYLIKKKWFKTIVVDKKIRVDLKSLYAWLETQDHYHLVDYQKEAEKEEPVPELTPEEMEELELQRRIELLNQLHEKNQ